MMNPDLDIWLAGASVRRLLLLDDHWVIAHGIASLLAQIAAPKLYFASNDKRQIETQRFTLSLDLPWT